MGDNKGETAKKQTQQSQQQQLSPSPKDPLEESPETRPHHHQQPPSVVVTGAPFISTPLYVPIGATSSPFDQQFDTVTVTPKRPRYATAQWKILPSPSQQQQTQTPIVTSESSPSGPSPSTNPTPIVASTTTTNPQTQQLHATAASCSDTASSPPHSPITSLLAASGHETSKTEGQQLHHQLRKGKYVSPVWKPNEMLWLARAWRVQYQGGYDASGTSSRTEHLETGQITGEVTVQSTRGKTRADKDAEVAEFLQRHGVNRDAKTAGTKWDNMLGEFRKVYEWERGSEGDQMRKSYFRISPYERKQRKLPTSFDEEVFEELSQFMGSRMRTSSRGPPAIASDDDGSRTALTGARALPPPLLSKKMTILSQNATLFFWAARTKQVMTSGAEAYFHGSRGSMLGFETSMDVVAGTSSSSKERRRIGKIRMTWEESVSLWAEEGENRGRVRVQGSSFLNADELTFFDDSMVACTMEAFEDGPLKGFVERAHPSIEPSIRSIPPGEFQDPTEYYVGCLRVPPTALPNLFELSWYLQEPPPEELRFPLRRDVYRDLPPGKERFFATTSELLDCRVVIVRKDSSSSVDTLQDQWPNVTGFVRNFCLWRGEETDQLREGLIDPSSSIVEKLLWTYMDIPYILGYYAVGYLVTFCALYRSQDRIIRTDLCTLDLSSPVERLKALVPCYRIAGLLPLLAERCFNNVNNGGTLKQLTFSDFERVDAGDGGIIEMTPNTVTRFFPNRRKWAAVKEIYDFLDQRIPHAEFIYLSREKDLALVFKPRGVKFKPTNCEQLVEALKYVTKALVALHDLSFMHRDLSWDKVMRRGDGENEWFVCGFDEAVVAPQLNPHETVEARGRYAPEMGRGLHGVKVDVWGVGHLVKTCGLCPSGVPKMLKELQNSAASTIFHDFCSNMAIDIPAIVVSSNYRLAPENRLPAAYDDAEEVFQWIKNSQLDWLREHADYNRCFIMGSSAGANIAYHAGFRVGGEVGSLEPLKIKGLILHHPFIGGTQRTESELRLVNDLHLPLSVSDLMWDLSLPIGVDRDHEYCNPTANGGSKLWENMRLLGWRVLVTGCDGDPTIDRQMELVEMLRAKNVGIASHFSEGGYHVVELKEPSKFKTLVLVLKEFMFSSADD
ncbi:hypothetical protein GH714_026867 [Hevea brasiliensis]|uniref:Alpha/beta hydrolase fold-3 domain-containing protein n=1 Tax=Hevea brasiliensis TaxID=3981 RepID=A0A6A6MH29_HEVBR|nr:hypothetical protein GH714_026867 [Hevea brasiliensis]